MEDPETGEKIRVWGYGALKGLIDIREDIDWTALIWEQVFNPDGTWKEPAEDKHVHTDSIREVA